MRKLLILSLVVASFAATAEVNKPLNLTDHRITELEQNIIGKEIDLYSMPQVESALNGYDEYLLLCSGGLATEKCAEAKLAYPRLKQAYNQHVEYQNKLQAIRDDSSDKAAPIKEIKTQASTASENKAEIIKVSIPKWSTGEYAQDGPTHSAGGSCGLRKGASVELTGEEKGSKVLVRYIASPGINSSTACEPDTLLWLDKAMLKSWK